jgi:hypothetical protein
MKRLFLATALLAFAAATPASAEIILDTNGLGGTGNNVIFNSVFNTNTVLGTLNGQNQEVVRFVDRSGNGGFTATAGQNGNDIKLFNSFDLDITVFDSTNTTQLGVTREVFSLVGSGTVVFTAIALEADGSFKPFVWTETLKNGQNGFDFTAINGEKIWDLDIFLGPNTTVSAFEHYRIDVTPNVGAVPEASTWIMLLAGFAGIGGMAMRRRRQGEHAFRIA